MQNDHLKIISLNFALATLFALFQPAAAQIRNQVFAGTRPISMGEAFVAVADDGNAIYWNPAGLARMERILVNFAYADLFGLGIKNTYVSFISRVYFIPPLTDYLAFGADLSHIKLDDDDKELAFSQDQINISLGFRPPKNVPLLKHLSVGANLKYLRIGGGLDGNPKTNVGGWGWDTGALYDLGALPHVLNGLQIGLMVHNIGGGLWVENKFAPSSSQILHENIRYGLSYRPFSDWPGGKVPISDPVIALDFDDRVHVGLEFWLLKTLALRAGFQKDWRTDEKPTLAFGVGFKGAVKDFPEVRMDYALTDTPVLPNTTGQFGGSLLIKDNPRAIRITGAQINDVFASLYQHYGLRGEGVGSIKLENVTEGPLTAWITFQTNRYMQSQAADTISIAGKSTIDFPLRAVFTPDILNAREGRLTGEVKVIYEYRQDQHATTGAVDFLLRRKNSLTWDDPGKAAAFVTMDNPTVMAFVDEAFKQAAALDETSWFSRYNMAQAMIIFRALQAYGIKYRVDPVTPFPSLRDTLHGSFYRLDQIQYPADLLGKADRAGDCDDLSVLYASMLQYAGLPTAFVSVPGHIFIMFDTGISIAQSRGIPISPNLFVRRNGTLWVPIETTMIPRSTFSEAWETAAKRLDNTWQIYEVAVYQDKYPPAPRSDSRAIDTVIQFSGLTPALEADLAGLDLMKADWLQKVETALEHEISGLLAPDAARARNVYGVLLGQNDEYSRAKAQFQKILKTDSTFTPARNNLGNIEFITGNFAAAEKAYLKTLRHNRYSRGTHLNLAILYQMMKAGAASKDTVEYQRKSEDALWEAAQLLEGDISSAFAILQYPEEASQGVKAGLIDKLKKAKKFIEEGFKKYARKQRPDKVALDRHGAKGRGEIDEARSAELAWIY